jgi:hypothetical protein
MTTTTVASRPSEHVHLSNRRLVWAGPLAIVGAVAANAVVRAVELAVLPVPNEFFPLRAPASFVGLTVAGMLGAVIAYAVVGRFSKIAVRTFRIVAGVALLLSFLPDLGLLVGGMPGATLTGVLALMVMHVVAAAIAVGVLTGLAVE